MQSIQSRERIVSMDMMRGVSILGIFLINMLSFHSPMLYIDPLTTWTNPIDQWVYKGIDVLIQGSFYPLFSFLFGYGLMILRENTLARTEKFIPIALRRLFFLLAMGWVHAHYIWHGDILFTYAVFGLMYLPFMQLSGKIQTIIAAVLFFVPNLFLTGMMILASLLVGEDSLSLVNEAATSSSYQVYQTGTYTEITQQRTADWYYVNNSANTVFIFFSIFPLFLLGGAFAKWQILRRVKEHGQTFLTTAIVLFVVGILLKSLPYIMEETVITSYIQDTLGGPFVAMSYLLWIAWLAEKKRGNKMLHLLAPVGKLSLSNYLAQSLIATLIFYSYGLGLYGSISVLQGTALALGIFSVQVIVSHLWTKKFLFGPFEWVWRCVTYGKKQPFVMREKRSVKKV